jgi:hypothetical protein
MKQLQPTPPPEINALAAEVLERLKGQPGAEHIIIGGGVALQHYCPHRSTVDLDGWWRDRARHETELLLEQVLQSVARQHGWTYRRRAFGDTQSFDLVQEDRKVFTAKITLRSVPLDQPLLSVWAPVWIETFRDNLGAKMNALVGRGAPRDFTDVFEVCHRGLASVSDCWTLWQQKNPGQDLREAKSRALHHLEQIAARRPLQGIADAVERDRTSRLRAWVRADLCAERL